MKRAILTKRRILFAGLSLLGASGGYLAMLCFPDPFFAYQLIHGTIILRSDEPIPASARPVLDEAERQLTGSPLNQPATKHHIYICNRPWRFLVFANFRHHVGGLTYPPLSNNIYLRAVHFEVNRLVGPSGNEVSGERTISYFVAHEIAHTLIADRLGAVDYWRLPDWKNEGYADYLAKGADFSYEDAVRLFRAGVREMDPVRSGLYLRYHLLVAHLLLRRRISVDELLEQEFDSREVERELTRQGDGLPW
jgi:hypothetical protein